MKFEPFAAKHTINMKGQRPMVTAVPDWYYYQGDGSVSIRLVLWDMEAPNRDHAFLFMSKAEAERLARAITEQLDLAARKVEMEKWVME